MQYQNDLRRSLEAVTVNANAVLQYLDTLPKTEASHGGLPGDPFDSAPKTVDISRKALTDASSKLAELSVRPAEYLDHLANDYQNLTCLKWLVNLNVLKHIPDDRPIKYTDLATKASVPWTQLRAVARLAISYGFLAEPELNYVAHSRKSALFARDESFMNWARWMVDYSMPTAFKFPEATQQWGETDAKDQTAFNVGLNVSVPFFDHLRQTPAMNRLFADYMRNVTSAEMWSLDHAVAGFDWGSLPAGAVVVDVGGSLGHGSIAVAKAFPHLNFIVQDLPEVIANASKAFDADESIDASVKARISFMVHDFFQPQPVTDADVYFLRMICHDWPDGEAKKILTHTRKALKLGAKVVVMDAILPQPGSVSMLQERQLRVRDLMMMQVFNAKERELEDWTSLVETAGLQVAQVVQPSDSIMGLLTIGHVDQLPTARLSNGRRFLDSGVNGAYHDIDEHAEDALNSTLTDRKPVLIMGAGIGGLCLAQALKRANIPFRIFERDPAIDARPQGYRLKLEADAAQSLKDCLRPDVYKSFEASCAVTSIGETDLSPFTGTVIHSRAGGGLSGRQGLYASFTVDRKTFRTQLMTGISEHIAFNKELVYYKVDEENGTVTAEFKDGSNAQGSFLVGADGLSSSVRKGLVPQHQLVDTGAMCVYGKTVISPEILARFPEKGLRWMTVASDSAPMLQSCLIGESPITLLLEPIRFSEEARAEHPNLPADYLYWALIGRKERFGGSELTDFKPFVSTEQAAVQAARLTMAITEEWHPSIRSLFELQDQQQASLIRIASTIPEIAAWKSTAHVTVLGDAIHPMSPCGGVGANTALCDAAALAEVLVAAGGKPSAAAVGTFEGDMRRRACRSILRSEIGSVKMFGQKPLVHCPTFKV